MIPEMLNNKNDATSQATVHLAKCTYVMKGYDKSANKLAYFYYFHILE